jgi:hypothetical protein
MSFRHTVLSFRRRPESIIHSDASLEKSLETSVLSFPRTNVIPAQAGIWFDICGHQSF